VFIQMVQGRCSRQDDLRRVVDDWCTSMASQPGRLGGTYGFTDDSTFIGVVRFDSQDACARASELDDAGMWWAAAAQCFDSSPELHESSDVTMMLNGGSDDAGFVQLMRGRVGNVDKLRRMTGDTEMTNMLRQARPDIIGATLAIEDDGHFIETIAFTSEAEAREREQMEMPAEVAGDMAEAMAEVEYLDLHRPWFRSHP
jgi:hypothetical protein